MFRPIEEVELDEATIRHNDAVAAAIPTGLSVPSLGSTATHRTDATVRRSEEQYNDLIKSFLEPGVIVAPGDRGSRGQKVWMLVNVFCQNTGLMEFKNSQVLSRWLNKCLKKAGNVRIVAAEIMKKKSRSVYWNINIRRLAMVFRTTGAFLDTSNDECLFNQQLN